MKRLIGCAALLCLMALLAGCGGGASSGTLAYVSNSTGSGFTVFTVNTDGSLSPASISPITTPAPPKVIQFSPNGRWAYFLDTPGANIVAFTRAGNGKLATHIDTFPVSGNASSLVIAPNNKFLYVALPGASSGQLAIYSIDQATGILSQIDNIVLGYQITQLAIDPNGNVLYALAPNQQTVITFTINSNGTLNGPILPNVTMPTTLPPNGMILSANGEFLYLLDETGTQTHTTNGSVNGTALNPAPTGQSPNIFGYVTSSSGILAKIAGSPFPENADLTPLGKNPPEPAQFPTNPVAGATSADSRFLFVANQGSHNISVFSIDTSTTSTGSNTGALTEVGVPGTVTTVSGTPVSSASPFDCGCTAPAFIAVPPKNNAIYVLNEGQFTTPTQTPSAVFQFAVDPTTGKLRAFSPASLDLGTGTSPTWITVR